MESYLTILNKVLTNGTWKDNRTGVKTISITGAMFEHDMSLGFPLLTTKKMASRTMKVELEGFIKGVTDKKWFQERNCHIWDQWCNPQKVPYGTDNETKKKMFEERDLGPIYGFQWRHFDAEYQNYDSDYTGKGIDQLANVIMTLKNNPNDRRMIVSAWNPKQLHRMALPPCHYSWQILTHDGKLDLIWQQRSVDTPLGLPFNIASYGLLLHLIAKEAGLKERTLVGQLGDVHIYENQLQGVKEQLTRTPLKLPKVSTRDFKSLFDWTSDQTEFPEYQSHPKIEFSLAV
ncbi:MAG: thymidylate synthase [Nanoarchaeota archaeon]